MISVCRRLLSNRPPLRGERSGMYLSISPSLLPAMRRCQFLMQSVAQRDKTAWVCPECEEPASLTGCASCNFGCFEERDLVSRGIIGWVTGQKVSGCASDDPSACMLMPVSVPMRLDGEDVEGGEPMMIMLRCSELLVILAMEVFVRADRM